jgi:serine/threonine-protein kinase HipA
VAALDIRDFLDGLVFNVLIGNADAHGKNYSILYRKAERRLAPLYDLVCTLAWPELSKTPAMKIGKSESIKTILPAQWQKMAQESRVGWPMLRERIMDLCARTVDGLRTEAVLSATDHAVMAERVAGIIEERAFGTVAKRDPSHKRRAQKLESKGEMLVLEEFLFLRADPSAPVIPPTPFPPPDS